MGKSKSAAPALTCGLALIRRLTVGGAASLEDMARVEGWPKSSTLRYLRALEGAGVVRQDAASKVWHLCERLVPCREASDIWNIWRGRLTELAEATRHCTELYTVGDGAVLLADRADPVIEGVQILARVGFSRDLSECDATCQVYLAFGCNRARAGNGRWLWKKGRRMVLTPAQRNDRLTRVRAAGLSRDDDFNENGVRRFAVPVIEGNALRGVFTVAQRLTPRWQEQTSGIVRHLRSIAAFEPKS